MSIVANRASRQALGLLPEFLEGDGPRAGPSPSSKDFFRPNAAIIKISVKVFQLAGSVGGPSGHSGPIGLS